MNELDFEQKGYLKIIEEFDVELKALLKKYDAEIRAEDEFDGYSEGGQDIQISVDFNKFYASVKYGEKIHSGSEPKIEF